MRPPTRADRRQHVASVLVRGSSASFRPVDRCWSSMAAAAF